MKKITLCLLLVVLFSCPVLANVSSIAKYGESEYVEGEVLVMIEAPAESDYS